MKKRSAVVSAFVGAALLLAAVGVLTAGAEDRSGAGSSSLPESSQVDAIPVSSPEEKTEGSAPEKEAVSEPEETVPTGYNGWKQWRDGSWSYCKNGAKTTGWQKVAGTWYFLNSEGIMRTGWAWYSGSWYYLKSSGAMATGWVQNGGKWYFLDADGRMLKGFIHDGKAWYYLDSSGAWVEHYTDAEVTSGGQKIRIVNGIAYVDGILIANKKYPLPKDYAPGRLADDVQTALAEMQAAAKKDGLSLYVVSGYRSYDYQGQLYNNYCKRDGKAAADRYSARPGYSEHQTGLAFDLNSTADSFAYTPEAKWIAAHAQEYGFIVRYPKEKEAVTGYKYEPWHLRYLGKETAQAVYDSGLCLEEYLGIDSYYLK